MVNDSTFKDNFLHLFASDSWSSTVYTYVFHRHINDGTFHLAEEKKERILPGLFGTNAFAKAGKISNNNESQLDTRISQLLSVAALQVKKNNFPLT